MSIFLTEFKTLSGINAPFIMQQIEPITFGRHYHIYNRGIDSCNLFHEPANYLYFMKLYEKYMDIVAHTYAWVLMPNHFHLLIKIREQDEIKQISKLSDLPSEDEKLISPSRQFANLFNAYAQAYNKRFNRHGTLFERPFKRKLITEESYLKNVLLYIHNNPVHHGFCEHPGNYPWSSYQTSISTKPTRLERSQVIEWFDDLDNFKAVHHNSVDVEGMDKWLDT